jgi:hypothetical protein
MPIRPTGPTKIRTPPEHLDSIHMMYSKKVSNKEGFTPKRARIKQPIRTWNSTPPEVEDVGVDVGISQDRRNIHKGETFALFYQQGPDPRSMDIQTDCLALDVRKAT